MASLPAGQLTAAASSTTSTTEVPRIVGDPLPAWETIGAGVLLLVVILAAGLYVQRRTGGRRPTPG